MRKQKLKKVPVLKTEAAERSFWAVHDSAGFVDWSKARPVTFPNLKPSSHSISLRLPDSLLSNLKLLANRQDVPYQSLMKVYLVERVRAELGHAT